ncbi:Nucleotidylyl transferase [Amylocystis lapponica]|nr:Nucleotidylyl transferase [Amylocystis lapponica]
MSVRPANMDIEPVGRSILLASIHDLHEPPTHLASAISTATTKSTERLHIILVSPSFDVPSHVGDVDSVAEPAGGISHTEWWNDVQRLLTFVYVQATKVAQDTGRVLMDINVLLQGTKEHLREEILQDAERIFHVPSQDPWSPPLPTSSVEAVTLHADAHHPHAPIPSHGPADPPLPPQYPVAALGGTFDHLHAGHKILLSMGAWIASRKLIVGVTDDALLKNKANKDVLETLPARMARVRAFLQLFQPALHCDVVPISDVYGPTGWDPDIQALVVSKETLPGASSIHKHREEKGLPPLRTFVIDVISSTEASVDSEDADVLKRAKMSSTFIREWIVQTRLKKM